jgi:peptidoglycan/LPS O-acetylase OafA/YrhL
MIRKLPLLSGCAILAVVLHHATNWGFIAMFWWTHRYRQVISPDYAEMGSSKYYVLVSINQLALFSVPAFIFITGLFITYASQGSIQKLSKKVIRNRVLGLLWPYLMWTILVFICDGLLGIVYTPREYIYKIFTGGGVRAYFFVPLLIQFYLLSPLLIGWAKNQPIRILTISGLLQLMVVCILYLGSVWPPFASVQKTIQAFDWIFIPWTFYFVLGIVVGFRINEVSSWLKRHRRYLILLAFTMALLSIIESQWIYHFSSNWDWAYSPLKLASSFYALFFILAFLAVDFQMTKFVKLIAQIGGMSYGIYLMHPKVVELLSRIMYHAAPNVLARQVILSLMIFTLTMLAFFLVRNIVLKSPVRKGYRYIFG